MANVDFSLRLEIVVDEFSTMPHGIEELRRINRTVVEVVDFEVENALLKNALDGNVTAQIFWLKNRKKNQWREKQEFNDDEELNKLDKLLEEQKNAYMDN